MSDYIKKEDHMKKDMELYINIINEKFAQYAKEPTDMMRLCSCGC